MKWLIQIEGDKIIRQIPLKKSTYSLGRGSENDFVFDTPKVSRVHAVLLIEGDTYSIIDKNSTNHVFVNGEQVRIRKLISGDRINLSKDITLIYLNKSDSDEKVTDMINRMWNAVNKKDFLLLKEVTHRIVALDNLDHILNIVLEEVVNLVGAERGFIALTNEKGEIQADTSLVHNLPLKQSFLEKSDFSHSIVRQAIEKKENIFILSTENNQESLSHSIVALELQSVMCSPLIFGDKLVGILYVDSGYKLSDFNETDQLFFTILSDHAAIAIENARLYGQVKKSVQELRKEIHDSEERYRHTLEAAPDAIIIIRLSDGHLVQVNNAFTNIFGHKIEESIGKTACELELFVYPKDIRHVIKYVTKNNEIRGFEAQVLRKNGLILDVIISARFLCFAEESCMVMVVTDITERKKAEDALRLDESRLEALLELNQMTETPIETIKLFALEKAVRLTKSETGYIALMNDDETLLTLHTMPECEREACALHEKPESCSTEKKEFWKNVIKERKALIINDYTLTNHFGSKEDSIDDMASVFRYMNVPIFEGNKIVVVAGVGNKGEDYNDSDLRQLTLMMQGMWRLIQRKKAEDELRNLNEELEQRVAERTAQLEITNQQLEEAIKDANQFARDAEIANISKSEFLANMSHEIRTPMNGIIGTCDLIMSTDMDRNQKEYMNIIQSSARSLLELINDILDFSKIEAGKLDFEHITFSPRDIIGEVCDMFFEKIAEKESELILNIASDVPWELVGDPFRLRQVLVNLTSNAFKFTNKGEICIQCSVSSEPSPKGGKEFAAEEQGFGTHGSRITKDYSQIKDNITELLFCVRDTGIGIDPENQHRLFDAFIQADGSVTRKYGGTGLGLTICKRIINMMGGVIWVESELGKGSSFYFTAKFESVPNEIVYQTIVPNDLKNLNILVVEDNISVRDVMKELLESFGFRAKTVASAEEAVEIYKNSKDRKYFDLIIMDFKFPGMDGITASEIIKEDAGNNAPPIIIISGYIREKDIRRAKEIGIESYMIKPIKQSQLLETILEIFGYNNIAEYEKNNAVLFFSNEFKGLKILVVEDHPVNQRVATEILEKEGISVDIAVNGIEAINAVRKKKYHALLMDIQMPEMDGIEATERIRAWESEIKNSQSQIINNKLQANSYQPTATSQQLPANSYQSQIPIIAMTAHVMSGDRQKCLEAGMNDYISKPINRKELFAALRRNIPSNWNIIENKKIKTKESNSEFQISDFRFQEFPGLNIKEGLERIGGAENLYIDILKDFYNTHQGCGAVFRELIQNKEFEMVRRKAHALKGASGNISAKDLRIAAKALEEACKNENQEQILEYLIPLEQAFVQLGKNLERMAKAENDKATSSETDKISDSPIIDSLELSALVHNLDKNLEAFDPVESERAFKELKARISSDILKTELELLEQQINKYDFDDARKTLKKFTI